MNHRKLSIDWLVFLCVFVDFTAEKTIVMCFFFSSMMQKPSIGVIAVVEAADVWNVIYFWRHHNDHR